MANLPPGDPKLVSQIVNHLKSQGLFDQFRRDCLADVDTKPAYQNLRQRVDNFVANHLANHTWSPHLNKNQLRNNIRQQVLKSGMLESGIDRIISQVVDPKINHIFRPQVEKVVHEFLANLNGKDDVKVNSDQTEERYESSVSVAGSAPTAGPSTSVASDAMSILETISSLNQGATTARALTETSNHKNTDKTGKKLHTQQSVDSSLERDHGLEDSHEVENRISDMSAEGTEMALRQEGFNGTCPPPEDVQISANDVIGSSESRGATFDGDEQSVEATDISEKKTEAAEKAETVEEKRESRPEKKNEYSRKSDDGTKYMKERDQEPETIKHAAPEKSKNKKKTADVSKEESASVDSDMDAFSDITVSSVHTSDLSSFDEESEEDDAVSESTEEGEITSDDEDKVESQSNAKSASDQSETKPKSTRHAYIHKPYLYSKYYSDSDDELTVEQRRQSVAKAKEERFLRRQVKRERLEEKRRLKALEKNKTSKPKSQGVEHKSSKSPKAASIKEVLKEQMFLEKKVAMSKKLKRHMRADKNNFKQKDDLDEDSKDSQRTNESCEKMIPSIKETKHNPTKNDVKPSRNLGEDSSLEKEHKRKTPLQIERSQHDDVRESRKVSERSETNSDDQEKNKNVSKPDKHAKKESGEAEAQNTKINPKKEPKLHKNGRERTYSEDHSSSKHKYKTDNVHKASEESDLHRLKKNSKEDDNLRKRSQSKSSSEERSDRKSKHKSDGKSSVYGKEEKIPSAEHKTDGNSHKDGFKRERHQSTDKTKSDHRYKRSLSDPRPRRDSQGSSREHSVSQKKSKNDVDSANSDNSKQEDSSHKDKRIRQISEDRASTKAIAKSSSSRSLKAGDPEETSQKSEKDKSSLGSHMEKHRKSKSVDKDREDRIETVAQSSNSVAKESSHKSKHSSEKGRERSRSEHREHSSSKKSLGEKSSNLKHSHKDAKRKEDNSKQQEKPGKQSDEKRLQERGSSLDTKSNKKATGEMKGESSRAAGTKKSSKPESENDGASAGELAKVSTSFIPTEAKDPSCNSNTGRPDENSKSGRTVSETKEATEPAVTDFMTESYETSKGLSLKSKSKNMPSSTRTSNASRNISPIIPTLDFHETKDLITLKLHSAVNSAASMSCSGTTAEGSNDRVCNSRSSSRKNRSLENRSAVPQTSGNENLSSEQRDTFLETNVGEHSKMSRAAAVSEITGSSDAEISTSDAAGEEGKNVAEQTAISASSSFTPNTSLTLSELDNTVSGNDVEEDSVMDTLPVATESNRMSIADENASHCGVEDNRFNIVCTESNAESSVTQTNVGETRQRSNQHSEMGPNTTSFRGRNHMECEGASTSSRPRENAATSSDSCVGTDGADNSRKGIVLTFPSYGENTHSTSAEADVSSEDADATVLSENSFEDATTTSSYSTNDHGDHFSEGARENAATSSQGATEASTEDEAPVGNVTMKAATSSVANRSSSDTQENAATSSENTEPNMSVTSENVIAHAATSSDSTAEHETPSKAFQNGITNAATSSDSVAERDGVQRVSMLPVTSSYNTEESNDAAPRASENVTTHAATSSSSMINSSGELNAEGSLVSSENDNENSAASSSSAMDSCMSENSRVWLKNPVERDENAASSSSTVHRNYRNEHKNNNFSHVEDSKNARATSSTQVDGAFGDRFMEIISSGTLKEYSVNSSDIPMDSSTEASDSVDRLHCSSSGTSQSRDFEKDVSLEKAKENNTASSSSALDIGVDVVCQGPVVHNQNGGEEAASSSSSSYMENSALHRDNTPSSENPETSASSSIAMNSSSEQVDVSVTCPGNSNDNAATSSSSNSDNRASDVCETKQNNVQASTSSNIAMDSSTGEDMDVEFATDMERGASTATCSSSLNIVGMEPKSELSERDIGISASSSSAADGCSKEETDVIICKERLSENAATSSDMMDSSTENSFTLSNSAICATTSTSNTGVGGADKTMDRGFNICCEINSEATAASSSSVTDDNSNNGGHDATSSNYVMGSSTGIENLSLTYLDKNEEAASSSGLISVMKLPGSGTDEPIGSQAVEHATTSSMERTNKSVNSFSAADREEDDNSERDCSSVEAAAESSLAVSQKGICVIVTSEQGVLSGQSIYNNNNEPVINSNDIHNMEYERTDEKEDAVSSASSEEQKFCCNSSRQDRVAPRDGETDSAVTSVGSEVGESLSTNDNCEAFSHVTFGDVDMGSRPVSCPEDSAVSFSSGGNINDNQMSEANLDTRVTEHSDSGPSFEAGNCETGASADCETERPTNKAIIEEGEGTVTSTGITEENYSEKMRRGNQDGETSYSGTETEQGNVMTRQETRSLGVVVDDESAITSTGAKEDEEEGEGFVTSTGTASEDSSFSTGTEDNSNSAVMQDQENVTAYAEVVQEEINLEQVSAEDTTESVRMTGVQEHLQNVEDIKCTEEMDLTCVSGENTTGESDTLSNKCEINTMQMPSMDTGGSEHGEKVEEEARNEVANTVDETLVDLQQTEAPLTVVTNERNLSVESDSVNDASCSESNVLNPGGGDTDSFKCSVSDNDGVDDARELDNNNNEDPRSMSEQENPLTTLESSSVQPVSEASANDPLSHSVCGDIGTAEPENLPKSELSEDGNMAPVPEPVNTAKEKEEQSSLEENEETEMCKTAETVAEDLLPKADAEAAPSHTDVQGETCKEDNTDTDLAVASNAGGFPATTDVETSLVKTKEEETLDFVEEDASRNLNTGERTLPQIAEPCESPTAQVQEIERTEEACLPERTESDNVPGNELSDQDAEPQVSEETAESAPVEKKKSRGRKSLAKAEPIKVTKETEETHASCIKSEEGSEPKIETDKRKRGRPPKKRNLSENSTTGSPVKNKSAPGVSNTDEHHGNTSMNKVASDETKAEKCIQKSDVGNSGKCGETVKRRGRPKRSLSTSEAESSEPEKKRRKSQADEEEEDDKEESENDEDADEHKGATTRAASRLEAQRKLPPKPTTRAASKLGSPEQSSLKEKKRKEKSSHESPSNRMASTRSKTPQSHGTKRRRERSPQVVRTRGQQASEDMPTKRIKRQ
ncbi:biorientation of chromosomes in cell division protein 1-like 1 [Spea bombifrons]|uniref:biorientation of chromosomes in cell division protein 1-like 1 n=1 Tax=Spea bombifrons TaxID=233779 RepID=UPI002349B94F|nr:biorientation of chromosomes in cell division protein 1-like 1 [Spea bombifrons]